MQSKAPTIAAYFAELTPATRRVTKLLDKTIRTALPRCRATMTYGMPTYFFGERGVAFNAQKNYFSVYADPEIVKQHRSALKKYDVGKCCIRFTRLDDELLAALRKIIAAHAR